MPPRMADSTEMTRRTIHSNLEVFIINLMLEVAGEVSRLHRHKGT